jgi:tRNA-splicing ligase RtcB
MAVGNVVGGVLCGDAHVGYAQPVGGVVAYDGMISISGVGFDIACGNMAVKTNIPFGAVKDRVGIVLRDISRRISFGLGRAHKAKSIEHPLFDEVDTWRDAGIEHLRQLAENQMLTCGSSNHYVDLLYEVQEQSDPDQASIWIGVHFGSRGAGFKTTMMNLKDAGGKEGQFIAPTILRTDSDLGRRYIAGMQLAGRYAYANREAVIHEIRRILGAREVAVVHNHHNFAWEEEHGGRKLWVVRKGATPAFPGQMGFIGGSMGDDAAIIEGVDSEQSRAAFYSTVHGAGRVMSRTEAKKTFTRHQMDAWLRDRGVTLIGGDVDESPMSYRRLDDVLASHEGTIKILHRLRPFGVLMASDEDRRRDPYHE